MMNGVIETATGVLLRKGFCDFTNDGSFDSTNETERIDVTYEAVCKKNNTTGEYAKWNGSSWETVLETTPDKLLKYKKKRRREIVKKTHEKLALGVAHNGKVFSASKKSQDFIAHMKRFIDKGMLVIPIEITTIEDETYTFTTIEDFDLFVSALLDTVKSRKDDERPLKQELFAAVDEAAVDAIIDDR